MTDINLTASPGTPGVNGLRIASLVALLGAAAFVMRHQASDRLPSLIRGLRLAGVKAILCGVFLVLASFAASAQSEDCPVYPRAVHSAARRNPPSLARGRRVTRPAA